MDLHPLFIHFPIALLSLYSFFEVINRFTTAPYWKQIRAVLVIAGTIGAFVALNTGEQAEHLLKDQSLRTIVEMHSLLASVTTWIYGILAAGYVIDASKETSVYRQAEKVAPKLMNILRKIITLLLSTPMAAVLAILGFLLLALVGSLGGMLVYGPDFDPVTSLIYRLLF